MTEQHGVNVSGGLSLKAQLYGLLVTLLALAFASALYTSIEGVRAYQAKQLASHAQDAAHNLGLAISPHLDEPGLVLAETMASAIFDSGYYKQIQFTDAEGAVRFSRVHENSELNVPGWFQSWFPLYAPQMQSEVANGWIPGGTLTVQSHVGQAYEALWQSAKGLALNTLWLLVAAMLIGYLILRAVLSPLSALKGQALAVMRKEFHQVRRRPFTLELRALVNAFNQMVSNTERSFSEQANYAKQLSEQLYVDGLTGLPNRQALLMQFEPQREDALLHNDSLQLGLIRLPSLADVNQTDGYTGGDQYLLRCIDIVQQHLTALSDVRLYRLSGSELAILCRLDSDDLLQLNKKLTSEFAAQSTDIYPQGFAQVYFTQVKDKEPFADTISRLDTLHLTQTDVTAETRQDGTTEGHSRQYWRGVLKQYTAVTQTGLPIETESQFEHLSTSLAKHFELMLQPILGKDGDIIYSESLVRFNWQQAGLSTAATFSMAERLNLGPALERAVLCFVLSQLRHHPEHRIGINLSNVFVNDRMHQQWLLTLLKTLKGQLPPLVFEIKESALINQESRIRDLIQNLKEVGALVTIEHFGAHLSSFQSIGNLDIDYVKIDGSFIRSLNQHNNIFFVQSLTQICHAVGVKVLACHVESATTARQCMQLHIDGIQGRGFADTTSINECFKNFIYSDTPTGLELRNKFLS
ncbi:EAL domain-containing protein [Bowmanella pacifica]|uniref:GGDEF domain-containing protein n=1 Tax=Bowmanella pacifica TaxID=502051 RepID=A0A917YSY4_9ALTE|nr:EAL domain-containing protein [Bowmanella pacifica]GGO64729.1 GGDEF domain-containing protein [Bowmanella pacifica]